MSETSDREIAELKGAIEAKKPFIARGDALTRLFDNEDFRSLFLDFFQEEEAVRLTSLLDDPGLKEGQSDILSDLRAIAGFRRFCLLVMRMHGAAMNEVDSNLEAIAEIEAEALEENEG